MRKLFRRKRFFKKVPIKKKWYFKKLNAPHLILSSGDIILIGTKFSVVSKLIRNITESNFSHAALYVGNNRIIESYGELIGKGGVKNNPLKDSLFNKKKHWIEVYRVKGLSKQEINKVVSFVKRKVGEKYDWKQFWSLVKLYINKKRAHGIVRDAENKWICFELIAKAFDSIGKRLSKKYPPAKVLAEDIRKSNIVERIYSSH